MALKDKAALVDLSKIERSSSARVQTAKTAIGMHAEALFRDEKVSIENTHLKQQLAEFEGANPARQLDPRTIVRSKWANRHEESFNNVEFQRLKKEIESAGGNIQPIKVRPLPNKPGSYELIFGHRRHMACLELGLPVFALIENMNDAELFCQMDRENRERSPLKPYEAGLAYARALDEGLFSSARKLAESASIDLSQLGKALALARLPGDILSAFPSPLDLQYRWATDLTQALQKDPDRVLAVAKKINSEPANRSSAQVLKMLVEGSGTVPPPSKKVVSISGVNGQAGSIIRNSKTRSISVNLTNIDPKKFDEITNELIKLIS
jgi:ParB family chromosome partitioning protein